MESSFACASALEVRGGALAVKPKLKKVAKKKLLLPKKRGAVATLVFMIRSFWLSLIDPRYGLPESNIATTADPEGAAKSGGKTGGSAPPQGGNRRRRTGSKKTFNIADLDDMGEANVIPVATVADLERALASAGKQLVVIDFWATWCGPCQQIKPKFADLSAKHEGRVTFLSVDVDKNKAAAQKYGVQSMPTFVFAKRGKEVDRFSGADINQLADKISRLG